MKIINSIVLIILLAFTIFSCGKKATPIPKPPVITPAIGVSYDGGIIFYLDGTGKHGLIAAPGNENVAAEWGCEGTLCGATGSAFGTGAQNTAAITMACDSMGTAAQVCQSAGWFLPSKDELDSMYVNLYLKGTGGFADGYYWSSTESNANNAWFQYFSKSDDLQTTYGKSTQFFVRPAKVF